MEFEDEGERMNVATITYDLDYLNPRNITQMGRHDESDTK